MPRINEITPRLAYLRGYHRGRSTGRHKTLEEVIEAVTNNLGWQQMEINLTGFAPSELLQLIRALAHKE